MMKNTILLIIAVSLFSGCIPKKSTVTVNFNKTKESSQSNIPSATVSSVQIINNQLVINGNGLGDVTNVKVGGTSFNEIFLIESKTATRIIANSIRAFSFDVSKVFNLIISDANASATFPIDFSLCNATLNGKGFNCAAPVADKDVLAYDAISGTWKPRPASGLNYLGTFDASANPGSGPAIQPSGAYYIISDDGSIGAVNFSVGDWLVSNGSAWQKIDNSTAVLSVFGRHGTISAQHGDYTLDLLGDISFPTAPVAGKVLKFDGTNWVAGDDLSGGGAGSVSTATIVDGAVTDAKITSVATSKLTGTISSAQIADGAIVNADINVAAAIDYSKLNVPNGAIPYAKLNIANGDIPYAKLNIANGDIPAAKISGLPSATAVLTTSITDGDTTHAPDANVVFDTFATKLDKTGGTITTILNVPTPVLNTEATTKLYVDTADNLKANKSGDTFSGVLTLDNDLQVKGGSNYVTVKGNAASAAYTLTLPANAGSANQVLTTNGSGALSWTAPTSLVSGLNASSISAGTVSNAEFDYLDGVTSSIQAQLNAKEASLATGGTTAQYFRGDKTLATLNTTVVTEGSNLYFTQARAIASSLTGVASASGTITAADTILGAFGKMVYAQGDYVSKSSNSTVLSELTISGTGSIVVPTPTLLTQAANMGYVQTYVDAAGRWSKGTGDDIYRSVGSVGIGTSSPDSKITVALGNNLSGPQRVMKMTVGGDASSIGGGLLTSSTEIGFQDEDVLGGPIPGAAMYFSHSAGGDLSSIGLPDGGHFIFKGTTTAKDISFVNGQIGIGKPSPRVALDVAGTVRVGTGTCTTLTAGAIGYNSTTNALEFCDGTIWRSAAKDGLVPASSQLVMKTCPVGWTNTYTLSGPGQTCNGSACQVCQSPATPSLIPASSMLLMESCPTGWTSRGSLSNSAAKCGEASCQLCEAPSAAALPNSSRVLAGPTCPASWSDIGPMTPASKCDATTTCRVCEVPGGLTYPRSLLAGAGAGTTTHGLSVVVKGGLGGTTSGNGGPVQINGGLPTDGAGGAIFLVGGYGATTTATARAGGNVYIAGGTGALTGAGGNVMITGGSNSSNIYTAVALQATGGKVGIGTSAPPELLSLDGSMPYLDINTKSTADKRTGLAFSSLNVRQFELGVDVSTDNNQNFYLFDAIAGLPRLLVNELGYVGIGVITPSQLLHVNGSALATAWNTSSDIRLKENINAIKNPLEKILLIRGVEFDWRKDVDEPTKHEKTHDIGVIAQEVEKVFPEAVTSPKEGYKSVAYSKLVAPLIEAVKMLYNRIVGIEQKCVIQDRQIASKADKSETERLKLENGKLKKENEAIKARLEKIEKALQLK